MLNLFSFDANARKFYFSTSGNDTYTTAEAQNSNTPWKTLVKLEAFGNSGFASAGDTFAFKRGDVFSNGRDWFASFRWYNTEGYTCPSGTAQNPIVFTNYGTGELPNFLFPNPSVTTPNLRHVLVFKNVSYIVIDGLQFNDFRFPVNDKVNSAFCSAGLMMGESMQSAVSNCVVKNCKFSNIGYGIISAARYLTIENNTFTNFKSVGDTIGINDIGADAIQPSGSHYLIKNNYISGSWAYANPYNSSSNGLLGGGLEAINDFDSSLIIRNTFIDNSGAMEFGQNRGSQYGPNDDTFAYNLFINNSTTCYVNTTGTFACQSGNLRFWNNVVVENKNSRFSGINNGGDAMGDGQSYINCGFRFFPPYPESKSSAGYYYAWRPFACGKDSAQLADTIYDIRNNIIWLTNGQQAKYSNIDRPKSFYHNNIYHLVGSDVNQTNLGIGAVLESDELISNSKIFSDTSNINPQLWNFNLTNGSPAINFGRNTGLNNDFVGMPVVANPDAGIYESSNSVINVLNVNINSTPILCFGGSSNVTIDASGGTPPYSGTGTFNVSAGTYNYTITDAVGNSKLVTIAIAQPSALTLNTISGRIIEFGGSTNTSCTATGGKGTYTYKLDAGVYQASSAFSSVLAGAHIVYVKDSNNCVTTKSITLTQPSAPLVITVTPTSIACNGDSSSVTVTATGGTTPYSGTGRFSRAAGTNTFTITDSNGVVRSTTITIAQPIAISATVVGGTIAKYGARTAITVSGVSGGTAPYTYSLNGGTYQTSTIFTNIPAGNYSVNIKDANACVVIRTLIITQPPTTLVCTGVSSNILCNGGTSTITISATGGTFPYVGIGIFTVFAGTYTFFVTDSVGSAKSITLTITQPTALTLSATSGRIIEFGGSTNINCTASGGKGTYTYKLDAGVYQSSSAFVSVLAGAHFVYVKDSNTCVTSQSVTLSQPSAALVITSVPTLIACNGDSSFVTVTAAGGTAPYTGTGRFAKVAGTYTFTISDFNGVVRSTTLTIAQPTAISALITTGTIGVYGAKTSITVSGVSGGTAPYTYSLNGGVYQTSNLFSNVGAGTYVVNIKETNGCIIQRTINITQPSSTLNATATYSTISCNGSASSVTVSATGGTPPYLGTGTISSLGGIQTFIVTDAVGASKSVVLDIPQPPAIIPIITIGRIIEFGGTGSINVTASGGTGTLRYKITNRTYQSTGNFTSVIPGTYTVSIKDGNACVVTQSITLTQPSATLTISTSPTTIVCNGDSSFVTVTASGGTAPYSGTGRFAKAAGTNTFTIADSNGVSRSSTITIAQPAAISATVVGGTVTKYGARTTITASGVSGGTTPYTYSLNGGAYQTSNVFTNIAAGNYTVNIKDANGCVVIRTLIITQPVTTLTCTGVSTNILCNGGTSTITISATGGTLPYVGTGTFTVFAGTYTYTVTDSVGSSKSVTLTIAQPTALTLSATSGRIIEFGGSTNITCTAAGGKGTYTYKLDAGLYQASSSFSSVLAGAHIVYVKDSNTCVTSQSITLTQPSAALTISASPTTIACNGDSSFVTVTASGGTAPYTGIGRFSKAAGTFTFSISDFNGIVRSSTITIAQPIAIVATVSSGFISVTGGTTSITVSSIGGGTEPYTYSLNGGAFQTGTIFSNVPAGTHSVVIIDSKGCRITKTIVVVPPVQITYTFTNGCNNTWNGTITAGANFGTPPYNYQIDNYGYSTRNSFVSLGPAIYRIYARDANGVISSTTVTIVVTSAACIKSANQTNQDSTILKSESKIQLFSIYPNPADDEFNIKISGLFNPSNFILYNSKGQKVLFESIANKKQFSFGKSLEPGIYYIRFIEGKKIMSHKIIKIK